MGSCRRRDGLRQKLRNVCGVRKAADEQCNARCTYLGAVDTTKQDGCITTRMARKDGTTRRIEP